MKRRLISSFVAIFVLLLLFSCGGGDDESGAQSSSESVNEPRIPKGVFSIKGFYIGQDFNEAKDIARSNFADFLGSVYFKQNESRVLGTKIEYEDRFTYDIVEENEVFAIYRYIQSRSRALPASKDEWDEENWNEWEDITPQRAEGDIIRSSDGFGGGDPVFQLRSDGETVNWILMAPSIVKEVFGSTEDLSGFASDFSKGYKLPVFDVQWDGSLNTHIYTNFVEPNTKIYINGDDRGRPGRFWIRVQEEKEASFD
jgi:hypothetical protein